MAYELIVIGASWGGLTALERILGKLPAGFPTPIAIAQHRSPDGGSAGLSNLLTGHSSIPVLDVEDKQSIAGGRAYLAPPDYHLYVDEDGFALSVDDAVLYSRPSIDVLFESASDVYRERLIGVILTGANEDGAHGIATVKGRGGYAIVQNPIEAERPEMPRAAMRAVTPDAVLSLDAIPAAIVDLCTAAERSPR